MTEALRDLSRKMDEVIGRQERTLGLLSVSGQGGAAPQAIPQGQIGGQVPPAGTGDSIRRHEVDALINNNNYLVQVSKELRTVLGEIQTRTDSILTNQARQPTAQIQSTGYDYQQLVSEMRDGLNQVRQGIAGIGRSGPQAQASTSCPSCVNLTTILVVTAVQLTLMLAYSLFK